MTRASGPYYAVVVLGATVLAGRPSRTLRARLEAGRAALEAGHAPRIIVTGRGEAEPMRRFLIERGVPRDAIEEEPNARTTYENAIFVAQRVPAGARVLLCTQRSHLPRALGLFSAQGVLADPLEVDEHWSPYRSVREKLALAHHRWKGWI